MLLGLKYEFDTEGRCVMWNRHSNKRNKRKKRGNETIINEIIVSDVKRDNEEEGEREGERVRRRKVGRLGWEGDL